jgi:hypothetical protein
MYEDGVWRLMNAPSTFVRLMQRVLGDLRTVVCVYMDDILIPSALDIDEHLVLLRAIHCRDCVMQGLG